MSVDKSIDVVDTDIDSKKIQFLSFYVLHHTIRKTKILQKTQKDANDIYANARFMLFSFLRKQ